MPDVDDTFVRKMEDVLATYERPYNAAEPVVCLDEKPIVLRQDARPARRVRPGGQVLRRDYEYRRRGTANVFLAVEPKTGRYLLRPTAHRKAPMFAYTLDALARLYPQARTIHLVMDNLNTHTEKSLSTTLGARRAKALWSRFTPHFTPAHASWLNHAECGLSRYAHQALGNEPVATTHELWLRSHAWQRRANRECRPLRWTFTRNDARRVFAYHPIKIKKPKH